jgi:hypothetical protein
MSDGLCVTDGANNYGINEYCTITATQALSATATSFNTEHGYDYITIRSTRYSGRNVPSNVMMAAGESLSWNSDHSVEAQGWTICATQILTPSAPPLPPPPPFPPGALSTARGGVVFLESHAAATLTHCIITDAIVTSNQLGSVSDTRGGVVFVADNAIATLSGCTIARASVVAASGLAHGGVMSIGERARGTLFNCTIVDAAATSTSGSAQGGVVGLGQAAAVTIDGCNISRAVARSTFGNVDGGVLHVGASATATLVGSIITNTVAISTAGSARGGMMQLSDNANASLTRCQLTNVSATARHDALGGCLMLHNAFALVVATQLQRCAAQSEMRYGEGGAAHVSSASRLIMSSGVLLRDNVASSSGNTIKLIAASAAYVLPAPPGRWISGSECYVRRAACSGASRTLCESVQHACSMNPDAQPIVSTRVGNVTCTPKLADQFQRCDYGIAQLLGQIIETLPEGAMDDDYPYACTVARFHRSQLLANMFPHPPPPADARDGR